MQKSPRLTSARIEGLIAATNFNPLNFYTMFACLADHFKDLEDRTINWEQFKKHAMIIAESTGITKGSAQAEWFKKELDIMESECR